MTRSGSHSGPFRGLLGGTFDPVHIGHLALAQEALARLGLDGVWFVPAGAPWMKACEEITAAEHRLAMVERAIAGEPRFHISTAEVDRPGPTYTVDTVEALRATSMRDGVLFFIMGADSLMAMHRWKAPERILELARVAVALRPGHGPLDLSALERLAPGAGMMGRIVRLEMPLLDISSSTIRERVAAGLPIRYLVPDAVAEYIARHRLYGHGGGTP